ncbi:hypothetical protein EV121DRAFT_274651 [Schizophyllum commune]
MDLDSSTSASTWRRVSYGSRANVSSTGAPSIQHPRTPKRKCEFRPTGDVPVKKGKATHTMTANTSDVGPRWLPAEPGAMRQMPSMQHELLHDKGMPLRIWANSRADLHAVFPEIFGTKAENTPISTVVDYMPVVVLDEESVRVRVDVADPLCCRLAITGSDDARGPAVLQHAIDGAEIKMAPTQHIPLYTAANTAVDGLRNAPFGRLLAQAKDSITLDTRLLDHPPSDIEALLEARVHDYPVLVVASRATLASCWRVLAPAEHAYCFLGLFRISDMQMGSVRHSGANDAHVDGGRGEVGEACWLVNLRWMEGGEYFLGRKDQHRPWWIHAHTSPPPTSTLSLKNAHESHQPSLTTLTSDVDGPTVNLPMHSYAPLAESMATVARTWSSYLRPAAISDFPGICEVDKGDLTKSHHDEGAFPSSRAAQSYHCMLDFALSAGWCCLHCGRINLQLCMRHRTCASTACSDSITESAEGSEGHYLNSPSVYIGQASLIESVRGPRDTLPIALPLSVYPKNDRIKVYVAEAENGMCVVEVRTQSTPKPEKQYSSSKSGSSATPRAMEEKVSNLKALTTGATMDDDTAGLDRSETREGKVLATHVFTRNMRSLQTEADQLFIDVQSLHPYFRQMGFVKKMLPSPLEASRSACVTIFSIVHTNTPMKIPSSRCGDCFALQESVPARKNSLIFSTPANNLSSFSVSAATHDSRCRATELLPPGTQ